MVVGVYVGGWWSLFPSDEINSEYDFLNEGFCMRVSVDEAFLQRCANKQADHPTPPPPWPIPAQRTQPLAAKSHTSAPAPPASLCSYAPATDAVIESLVSVEAVRRNEMNDPSPTS